MFFYYNLTQMKLQPVKGSYFGNICKFHLKSVFFFTFRNNRYIIKIVFVGRDAESAFAKGRVTTLKKYGLLGYPLGHTMSPPIHKALFELYHCEAEYGVFEIPPHVLEEQIGSLKELSGFNVTIPHKVEIMKYLDQLDEKASLYGAVNVVKCDGKAVGYNTDVIGFTASIEQLGATLCSRVLLLGCGGAGRMMAIETALQGGELTIAVRPNNLDLAQRVVEEIHSLKPNASVRITLLDRITGSYDLIINATPSGMYPHIDEAPIGVEDVQRASYLFDAVYNPIETKLMKTARQSGVKTLGGMAMLVRQAVAAHRIWNSASFREEDIVRLIGEMERSLSGEHA